jgi:recombination protein RecA
MGRPKGSGKKNKKVFTNLQPISVEGFTSEQTEVDKIKITPEVVEEKTQLSKEQEARREKLKGVMRDINKNIEGAKVDYANTIATRERQSFGYKCLDKLTGGGIERGNCSVIWGSKGCGKTTIALKLIATAQAEGKIAAYLDVERSYDPVWAKSFGVDTESLVYLVCPTAEAVMDSVIKLCKEKVVDVIVLDSVQGLSPHGEQYEGKADKERSVQDDTMALLARKLSQFFRMAIGSISEAKCALLLIGQARLDLGSFIKVETLSGGHALMHNSRLILRIRRGQGADAPTEKRPTGEKDKNDKPKMADVKIGFDAVIHVNKSQIQGCTEGDEVHVPFYFSSGIRE